MFTYRNQDIHHSRCMVRQAHMKLCSLRTQRQGTTLTHAPRAACGTEFPVTTLELRTATRGNRNSEAARPANGKNGSVAQLVRALA